MYNKLIRCPCIKYKCMKYINENEVRHHLYKDGFKPAYFIWTEHGEVDPDEPFDLGGASSSGVEWDEENQFEMINQMVDDVFRPIIDGETRRINQLVNEEPNSECQRFYNMLMDANKPIYEGCRHSTLSLTVGLINLSFRLTVSSWI